MTLPGDAYTGHPKLLFTASDVSVLRAKVTDGGSDDIAYAEILDDCNTWLSWTPETLLLDSEGLDAIVQFALASHLEIDGSVFEQKIQATTLLLANTRDPVADEFVSGLRIRTLALGYDAGFATASAAEQELIRNEIISYLDYAPTAFNYFAQLHNPYVSNHGMTLGSSIGLAVLAIWDDVSPAERADLQTALDFADALVQKHLDDLVDADGAHKEGVLYGAFSMRMAIPYFEARLRFDGFDYAADPKIQNMAQWFCYEVLPEGVGRTNNLNDSSSTTRPLALHGTYVDWIQTRFANPLGNYLYDHLMGIYGFNHGAVADKVATVLWHQPQTALSPETVLPNGKLFAGRGLYYYRSGWKTGVKGNEILFSFYSGKFYGGHAQEDQNHFTLYAYGDRYALDAGAVGAANAGPKQSGAHNLVLIDGLGEHNAGNSIGTDGNIAASLLTPAIDYLRGDAETAYDTYSPFNAFGVPFPGVDWSWGYDGGNPVDRADRLVLVLKGGEAPPYVIVADDIVKDGSPHIYDWTMHTDTSNVVSISPDQFTITGQRSVLDLYFVAPSMTLSMAPYDHGGQDPPTQRLVASVLAVEPRFLTAIVPRDSAVASPQFSQATGTDTKLLSVVWGPCIDEVLFNPGRSSVAEHNFETDGVLAFVRSSPSTVQRYAFAEGSILRRGALELVTFGGGTGSAVFDSPTLYVSDGALDFTAYGPGVTSVLCPTGPVPFLVHGDYVSSGTTDVELPAQYLILEPSWPNPFNPYTTLRFQLREPVHVRLRIYSAAGRWITTLLEANQPAGWTTVRWDGKDANGAPQASGIYIVQLETPENTVSRKVTLVR